jgi:hypothetical protein
MTSDVRHDAGSNSALTSELNPSAGFPLVDPLMIAR